MILQLYKVEPSVPAEADESLVKPFYLHGVNANKVADILEFGYQQVKTHLDDLHKTPYVSESDLRRFASLNFDRDFTSSKTDGDIGKLSFVFVVSDNNGSSGQQNDPAEMVPNFLMVLRQ